MRIPDRVLTPVTALVGASAIVAMLYAIHAQQPRSIMPTALTSVPDWRSFAQGGHRRGRSNAAVVITEFADFECVYCAREAAALDAIYNRHGGDVAIVYRHFPLEHRHPAARAAALAAECAADQGRFDAFVRLLFAHQPELRALRWSAIAVQAGVTDTTRFERCVRDGTFAPVVEADIHAGRRLGISGTPTLLVNSWLVHGAPPESVLDVIVERALASSSNGP